MFSSFVCVYVSLDIGHVDLYLMHSPQTGGRVVETYKAMLEIKETGKVK